MKAARQNKITIINIKQMIHYFFYYGFILQNPQDRLKHFVKMAGYKIEVRKNATSHWKLMGHNTESRNNTQSIGKCLVWQMWC